MTEDLDVRTSQILALHRVSNVVFSDEDYQDNEASDEEASLLHSRRNRLLTPPAYIKVIEVIIFFIILRGLEHLCSLFKSHI